MNDDAFQPIASAQPVGDEGPISERQTWLEIRAPMALHSAEIIALPGLHQRVQKPGGPAYGSCATIIAFPAPQWLLNAARKSQ